VHMRNHAANCLLEREIEDEREYLYRGLRSDNGWQGGDSRL
jgi:hypothetical protein